MPAPYNYMPGIPNPAQDIQGNILGGIKFGMNLTERQRQREAEQQQVEQANALREQFQADVSALGENKSPKDIANLIIKYPQYGKQFTQAYDILNESQKKARLQQASDVYAAILSKNPDIAKKLLSNQAEAYRNSGNDREALSREHLAKLLDLNPESPETSTALFLASALGPEKFVERFQKLQQTEQIGKEITKDQRTTLQKNLESAGLKPGTKEYKDAIIAGTKTGTQVTIGPQNESQRRDDFLAGVVDDSLAEMKRAMKGFDPTSAKSALINILPKSLSNWIKSEDYQRFTSAARPIIEAYLVKITGAAYSQIQESGAVDTYMPQPGDKEGTVRIKINRIRDFGKSLKKSAGYPIDEKVPEDKKDITKLSPQDRAQVTPKGEAAPVQTTIPKGWSVRTK